VLGDFGQGCVEERAPKVAVVVGAGSWSHVRIVAQSFR
jgi:hypothetical protein